MSDDKYTKQIIDDSVPDDSNLAQCEACGFVVDWDDVAYVNDWWSDGRVTKCEQCNEAETFNSYPAKIH